MLALDLSLDEIHSESPQINPNNILTVQQSKIPLTRDIQGVCERQSFLSLDRLDAGTNNRRFHISKAIKRCGAQQCVAMPYTKLEGLL